MKKLKLVLFGVSDEIIQKAMKMINFSNCEIVAFCDNDTNKQGLTFNNLPVLPVQKLKNIEYDFIIVTAWFSYQVIRNNLINFGVSKDKIMPLLSVRTVMLLVEPIEVIPEKILEKVFVDSPKAINNKINELNEVTRQYLEVVPFKLTEQMTDFKNYPLIAHAGGGIISNNSSKIMSDKFDNDGLWLSDTPPPTLGQINDKQVIYSNSVEAFKQSIQTGFKMFEFDIYGLIDNDSDMIFGHDHIRMDGVEFCNYKPLTLKILLSILNENPQLRVILDIQWNTFSDYERMLTKIDEIIFKESAEWNVNIKKNILMQAYDVDTIQCALAHGWECLLTSYRNKEGGWLQKTAYLCCKFKLSGAVLSTTILKKEFKYIKFLKEKNIPIIAFSVDNIDEYSRLKKLGVTSVMTNFLKP